MLLNMTYVKQIKMKMLCLQGYSTLYTFITKSGKKFRWISLKACPCFMERIIFLSWLIGELNMRISWGYEKKTQQNKLLRYFVKTFINCMFFRRSLSATRMQNLKEIFGDIFANKLEYYLI